MSANKTLIAYVSKGGATEEAARKIAETLRSKFQLEVDLVDLKEQTPQDLAQYQNIIVGGGVRGGKVYGKALKFLENDLIEQKSSFFCFLILGRYPWKLRQCKSQICRKNVS